MKAIIKIKTLNKKLASMLLPWFLGLVFLLSPQYLIACPVFLQARNLVHYAQDISLSSLRLFRVNAQGQWELLPVQVDYGEASGLIYASAKSAGTTREKLGPYDRLSFYSKHYGSKAHIEKLGLPCDSVYLFEVFPKPDSNRYVYLASCRNQELKPTDKIVLFDYNPQKRSLSNQVYAFEYNVDNHILFDRLYVLSPKTKNLTLVGQNADLWIHADVKNFFNFDFGSQDIESHIKDYRQGWVGFVANLEFLLHVLFFKINLELDTSISFFDTSIHIPMQLQMPVNAQRWLNSSSGTLYSWEYDERILQVVQDPKLIPDLDASLVMQGYQALGQKGLSYCRGTQCYFYLKVLVQSKPALMIYQISRSLVSRGFFPMLSLQLERDMEALSWGKLKRPISKGYRALGVYFNTSGLSRGGHNWDFWIQFGDVPNNHLKISCPEKAYVRRVNFLSTQ